MSDKSKSGSLFGKILLPGYTDAGPDSSFNPVQVSMTAATQQLDDDDDIMSEAATEIFDNRTCSQKQRLLQAPKLEPPKEHQQSKQQPKQQQDIPRPSPRKNSTDNNYGFFPSTKPMPSPRPTSPPRLTRRQVSTSSLAGTSTVPETGAFSGEELQEQERIHNSKENKSDGDGTGAQVVTLSEKALQAMDEKQSTTTSSEDASGETKQRSSLIQNDDALSYVSSTASEMGTVINIGSDRFAEIEAMADMVEANADFFEMEEKEMQQRDYMRRPGEKEILSLPILEGRSFEEPAVLPQAKSDPDAASGQDLGLKMKTTSSTNDTDKSTTPFIKHQQYANNPSTSAMVSAAIRRIGTGITQKSMSAPSTPQKKWYASKSRGSFEVNTNTRKKFKRGWV